VRRVTRRSVVLGLGMAGGAAALTACGAGASGGAATGGNAGSPNAPEVQLRYLVWLAEWGQGIGPIADRLRAEKRVVLNTEVANVGVTQWAEKLQTLFAGDAAPDAIQGRANVDPLFQDGGQFLDLAPYVARDKMKIDATTYALSGTERWCGKIFSLPHWADPNAIFYNKTLLKRVGAKDPWDDLKGNWTMENLVELAKAATRDTDGDGKPDQWGIQWNYAHPSHVGMLAWTMGGDVADFQAQKYTLDSPVSLEAHRQLQQWLTRDRILLPMDEATAIQRAAQLEPFQAGRVAFQVRAVTDVARNAKAIGSSFEWDVIHLPKSGSRNGVPLAAGHGQVAAATTKQRDRTWDVLRLLVDPQAQEYFATFNMPALKSKFGSFLKSPPAHINVFGDAYSKPYGIHFRHDNTSQTWDLYAKDGRAIVEGGTTLAQGLADLNRRMNDLVKFGNCQPYQGFKHPVVP
jgi:multiple sugar transport system substrate-binding protein